MDCKKFVEEQISEIKQTVGDATAINALSGGVDSSLVTVLGHRALAEQLKTVFVDNALMRQADRPGRKAAGHYKYVLREGLRPARQGIRREVPPPRYYSDRYRRDNSRYQTSAQYSCSAWHRTRKILRLFGSRTAQDLAKGRRSRSL